MTETIEEVCGDPELTLAACVDQTCPGAEPACLQVFCPIGYSEAACTQFVGDRLGYEANPNLPKPTFYVGMQVTPTAAPPQAGARGAPRRARDC